jgi:hypothetical protein
MGTGRPPAERASWYRIPAWPRSLLAPDPNPTPGQNRTVQLTGAEAAPKAEAGDEQPLLDGIRLSERAPEWLGQIPFHSLRKEKHPWTV